MWCGSRTGGWHSRLLLCGCAGGRSSRRGPLASLGLVPLAVGLLLPFGRSSSRRLWFARALASPLGSQGNPLQGRLRGWLRAPVALCGGLAHSSPATARASPIGNNRLARCLEHDCTRTETARNATSENTECTTTAVTARSTTTETTVCTAMADTAMSTMAERKEEMV